MEGIKSMKRRLSGKIQRRADGSLYCLNDGLLRQIVEEAAMFFLLTGVFIFAAALLLFGSYGSPDDRTKGNAETTSVIKNNDTRR